MSFSKIIDLYKLWVCGGILRLDGLKNVEVVNINGVNLKCRNFINIRSIFFRKIYINMGIL